MAVDNSKLECRSFQVISPNTRNITVLETVVEPSKKVRSAGLTYIPVQLEPFIVLRGQWLTDIGFEPGQKLTVHVEHNLLQITGKLSAKGD